MRDPTGLLIELYEMYLNGELATEYNRTHNRMVNSEQVDMIMAEVEELIPEKLEPLKAAEAMRKMEENARNLAIKESEDKVIDMRQHFQIKMSENGGALGLTKQLIKALEDDDFMTIGAITMSMKELVEQSEQV
jgi:citrate lyase alpha subunit